MESKYLVGYIHGKPAVIWDKIKDFEETVGDDGRVKLTFKENGIEYHYEGIPERGYKEINGKAPSFDDYKYMGRRTALRHDFLNDTKRIDAKDVYPATNTNHELEDDEYEEVTIDGDDGINACGGGGYFRHVGPCGREEIYMRGACGDYRRLYGSVGCGTVGNVCGHSWYHGCGGGC